MPESLKAKVEEAVSVLRDHQLREERQQPPNTSAPTGVPEPDCAYVAQQRGHPDGLLLPRDADVPEAI